MILKILPKHLVLPISVKPNTLITLLTSQDSVTRLSNDSLQKQVLFSCDHKQHARDRWIKFEKQLNISKDQIQRTMENKKEFSSLLKTLYT